MSATLHNLQPAFQSLFYEGDTDRSEPDDIALRLKLMNLTHAAVNQVLYGTAGPLPERSWRLNGVEVETTVRIRRTA